MTRRRQVNVDPRVTRHEVYDDGTRILYAGDKLKARLPGSKTKQSVTFNAYVVPDKGVPYIDVADKMGISRCIRPDAIISKDRRQPRRRKS